MTNKMKTIKISSLSAGLWLILTFAACAGVALAQTPSDEFITPDPILEWIAFDENSKGGGGKSYLKLTFGVSNWQSFPDAMFAAAPDLQACGLNRNASRTWLMIYDFATKKRIYGFCALTQGAEMQSLSFNVKRRQMPECVYITLFDRRQKKTLKSNPIKFTDNSRCGN